MCTFGPYGTRRHFLLCATAVVTMSGLPRNARADSSFEQPDTVPGENGWENYVDPVMIDRATAATVRPEPASPEAAVALFLASRIRGDNAWQGAMSGDLDRKGRKSVKNWRDWTLNAAQIKARKLRGEDRAYISVWMDVTIDGDAETGTDDFTVRREANGWRISGVPS